MFGINLQDQSLKEQNTPYDHKHLVPTRWWSCDDLGLLGSHRTWAPCSHRDNQEVLCINNVYHSQIWGLLSAENNVQQNVNQRLLTTMWETISSHFCHSVDSIKLLITPSVRYALCLQCRQQKEKLYTTHA
ncbi:hypothetical protein ILYODFUR_033179 [Ilyodon furcidens]|uniref:Uncharacterized protein n=1 Tax=Ilyodon furcidens TaxID=33524 RepID=A0ABV0T4M9_9TELE